MIYIMRLDKEYFDLVVLGKKKIEIRLNDSKRKLISEGDFIRFLNRYNELESIDVVIDELKISNSFKNVLNDTSSSFLGWSNLSTAEMLKKLYKIYNSKDEYSLGVLRISFHVI